MDTNIQEIPEHINRHSQSGFNLIEVMVALGILAFGILAIASMQETSLLGTSRAYSLTDGTTVAMDQIERLTSMAFTNPDLNEGSHGPVTTGRFETAWEVDHYATDRIKKITLTVTWREAGGAQKSTTLTSIKNRI